MRILYIPALSFPALQMADQDRSVDDSKMKQKCGGLLPASLLDNPYQPRENPNNTFAENVTMFVPYW
jgi:hypothetical protein